jgi:hypothetical protein
MGRCKSIIKQPVEMVSLSLRSLWFQNMIIDTLDHNMSRFTIFYFPMIFLFASCSTSDLAFEAKPECKYAKADQIQKIEMYSDGIQIISDSKPVAFFETSKNQMRCPVAQSSPPLHYFSGAEANLMAAGVLEVIGNAPQIDIKIVSIDKAKSFSVFVEEKCSAMKLTTIFGMEMGKVETIGCQLAETSKSAVMFRVNSEDPSIVDIASLKLYTPLISRYTD